MWYSTFTRKDIWHSKQTNLHQQTPGKWYMKTCFAWLISNWDLVNICEIHSPTTYTEIVHKYCNCNVCYTFLIVMVWLSRFYLPQHFWAAYLEDLFPDERAVDRILLVFLFVLFIHPMLWVHEKASWNWSIGKYLSFKSPIYSRK